MASIDRRISDLEQTVGRILVAGAEPTPRITHDAEACAIEFERFATDDLAGLSDEQRAARLEQRRREVAEFDRAIVVLEGQK